MTQAALLAVVLAAQLTSASPIVSQRPIPATSALVPPLSQPEADALARSGRRRLSAGIALLVVGVLGWGASTAGTVLAIIGYVKDARSECGNGACDTITTTGRWLGIGGGVVEAGGIGGGIALVLSGVERLHDARRVRLGVAAAPGGAAVGLSGRF